MDCSEAAEFIAYTPQRIIIAMQIIFCILSIIINLLFIKYCKKALFFHRNCRILLWSVIAANIVHSILLIILQTTHLIKMLTAVDPCDVYVPPLFCFVLRLPAGTCFTAHATIHLAMVIERGIATKQMNTYERSDVRIGYFMASLSVIFALGISLYSMHKYSFIDKTFYCSAATPFTMFEISLSSYFVVIMEAVILIMFGLVYLWNVKREKSRLYDLAYKYQNQENLVVLRLLMPMVLMHFVIYSCFMTACAIAQSIRYLFSSNSAFRAYISAVYIVPLYTVTSPLLLWWIVEKHRKTRVEQLSSMSAKKKDEHDIYFANYAWHQK
ncbi:hypothetical protein GCK32_004305 [Trichostrongylus colubriformis]|uniref:Uncharacterized protein n=1 Tax=Trichostrongylus colubriformis TaxID=6319 RepID=A0AAN8G9H7_TRICO